MGITMTNGLLMGRVSFNLFLYCILKNYNLCDLFFVEDDEDESGSEENESEEDLMSSDDLFKIPKVPNGKKSKFKDNSFYVKKEKNGVSSNRGRKRFVPIALKTCSLCGQEFADHAGK